MEFAAAVGNLQDLNEELTAKRVRYNALREQVALLTERCKALGPLEESIAAIDDELEMLKRQHRDISERLEAMKITASICLYTNDQIVIQEITDKG